MDLSAIHILIMVPITLIQYSNSSNSILRVNVFQNESQMKKMKMDAFTLIEAQVENDTLSVVVSYSGGCEKHEFSLGAVFGSINGDHRPVANLVLGHENNGDTCKKILRERLDFNLSPLKKKFQKVYGVKANSMILYLMNTAIEVKYNFN